MKQEAITAYSYLYAWCLDKGLAHVGLKGMVGFIEMNETRASHNLADKSRTEPHVGRSERAPHSRRC